MKDLLLKIYRNPGVRKAVLALALAILAALGVNGAAGCAALKAGSPDAGRALCYAAADQRAQARVDAECPAGGEFSQCPARDSIIDQLQADQEACP